MTHAEIAAVVGTERRPWWPDGLRYIPPMVKNNGNAKWCDANGRLNPELVEAALVGSMMAWLLSHGLQLKVTINRLDGKPQVCIDTGPRFYRGDTAIEAFAAACEHFQTEMEKAAREQIGDDQ